MRLYSGQFRGTSSRGSVRNNILLPVGAVIDAALISRSVDGYLLVVRHEHTDFKEINAMLNQLNRADAKILGFVYTNAPTENKKYYRKYGKGYYGSYYYYKKPDENN